MSAKRTSSGCRGASWQHGTAPLTSTTEVWLDRASERYRRVGMPSEAPTILVRYDRPTSEVHRMILPGIPRLLTFPDAARRKSATSCDLEGNSENIRLGPFVSARVTLYGVREV